MGERKGQRKTGKDDFSRRCLKKNYYLQRFATDRKNILAERVRFELTAPCEATVFKTAAFGHSATSPYIRITTSNHTRKRRCVVSQRFFMRRPTSLPHTAIPTIQKSLSKRNNHTPGIKRNLANLIDQPRKASINY